MADFNAARALDEAKERHEQLRSGEKLVPISASVIAVLAALATLFANHSSVSALAAKNEAILAMSKASDQYNYYESKRIKVQLNQGLTTAGVVRDSGAANQMRAAAQKDDSQAKSILKDAQSLQKESDEHYMRSEQYMQSYEKYEVAATLFEVCVVLVSITALMRTNVLLFVAGGGTLAGLAFLAQGLLMR